MRVGIVGSGPMAKLANAVEGGPGLAYRLQRFKTQAPLLFVRHKKK